MTPRRGRDDPLEGMNGRGDTGPSQGDMQRNLRHIEGFERFGTPKGNKDKPVKKDRRRGKK